MGANSLLKEQSLKISIYGEFPLACTISYMHMRNCATGAAPMKMNYGKCSKISNTLKLRTPKIIAENNF